VHNDFQHGLTWTLTLSLLINIKVNGSSRIMVNRTHITTQFGDIELEFYSDVAPKTVENFKKLAENRFYDGLIFHRIVPGFVIQGGDPHTRDTNDRGRWGTGGPGWTIKAEFNKNKHSRGAISMARSQDPDSAGSQFFIVLQDSYFLDGQYTVFGRVISGMDIVDKISSLKTDSKDAPIDPDQARMITVTVRD
jgi:cyclophilin family peptidyl-prolyl cis-trans isomerase